MSQINNCFLENAISRSQYYKVLAESAIDQLSQEEIHYSFNTEDNNISTIAKHISGNLLSRWTDFRKSDGEKPWRNRDTEFDDDIRDMNSLYSIWDHGWSCFLDVLNSLNPEDLMSPVLIRNEEHSILEAIQRQLNHNSYHIGQIVFLAKSIKGKEWKNLSIPKNKSKDFNRKMGI